MDKKDRLLYKGKILNKDYTTLYNYWKENLSPSKLYSSVGVPGLTSFKDLGGLIGDCTLMGEDKDSNTYWDITMACIVFDNNGWPISYFFLDKDPITTPAVNSEGDIFYLAFGYAENNVVLNLYRIKRQW